MFIYHRDSKNIQYRMPNGQKLKFINGCFITDDQTILAFFRNHIDFGNKKDCAVLFESPVEVVVNRTTESRQSDTSRPKMWVELDVQPLYPTSGRLYVCSKDGTRHANLDDLCRHIKQIFGEEYFASMQVRKEAPKITSFGTQYDAPPTVKMEDTSLPMPPCVGPYPINPTVVVANKLPTERVADPVNAPSATKADKPVVGVSGAKTDK
jgi:hypothetical protein